MIRPGLTAPPYVYPCGCMTEMDPETLNFKLTKPCGDPDHVLENKR